MDLVQGYKFFSSEECEKMRSYCDKKERKLEALLDKQADAPAVPEKASIPLTQGHHYLCLLYTSPSPRDATLSRMPSSA